jgi:hypothetical protein
MRSKPIVLIAKYPYWPQLIHGQHSPNVTISPCSDHSPTALVVPRRVRAVKQRSTQTVEKGIIAGTIGVGVILAILLVVIVAHL